MERVVVLGATNRPQDLDEAVLRRFSRRIFCDMPNRKARESILKVTANALGAICPLSHDGPWSHGCMQKPESR